MILPQAQGVTNLASPVLGQSAGGLGDDMHKVHGHPVLLAVTFVNPSRFTGACSRPANWQPLGRTKGFARNPGLPVTWTAHGQPKEIFVYPLVHDAREQLRALDDAPHWRSEGEPVPLTANRLGSLFECLSTIAEFRSRRGRRYPLPTIVAIAAAAKLAGYHGVTAFAEFAQALSQEHLRALRAYYSHRLQRFTAPTVTTFHNIHATLDPDVLDRAVRTWAAQRSAGEEPVAIDGKYIRGAARHNPDGQDVLVAAAKHCCGLVLGQVAIAHKSNEIPAIRTLASGLALAGRVVTPDILHTQVRTARHLVEHFRAHYVMMAVKFNRLHAQHDTARCLLGRRADYVLSAVKNNQETIFDDVSAIDWSDAPWHETLDKGFRAHYVMMAVKFNRLHAQHDTARCLLGHRAAPTMCSAPSRTTRRPSSTTSVRSTGATRPGTKPSTRAMAASSADAAPSPTAPVPNGTATPTSMDAARRCASNASARSSRPASAASK